MSEEKKKEGAKEKKGTKKSKEFPSDKKGTKEK